MVPKSNILQAARKAFKREFRAECGAKSRGEEMKKYASPGARRGAAGDEIKAVRCNPLRLFVSDSKQPSDDNSRYLSISKHLHLATSY